MTVFCNRSLNSIVSNEQKQFIINELYSKLTLSNYKYKKCEYSDQLNILIHNRYHLALNNFGIKFNIKR